MSLFQTELQGIVFLQKLRTPLLDAFFRFFNLFDTPEFFFLLIPFVWILLNKRWGIKIFYITALSFFFNYFIKESFSWPRPFHLVPSVGVIFVSGYGFPSGAAQNAVLFAGILISYWKNRLAWIFGFLYFFLLSFSRLYLGVHFFRDILGGWAIGVFLLFVFLKLFPIVETYLQKKNFFFRLAVSQIFLIFLFFPHPMILLIVLSASGLGLGFVLSSKENSFSFQRKLISLGIAFLGLTLLHLAFYFLPSIFFLEFFLSSFWISFGIFFLMERIFHLRY